MTSGLSRDTHKQVASGTAASRPPSALLQQWMVAFGDPRDHSRTPGAELNHGPWLPPGRNDAQRPSPKLPATPRCPQSSRPSSAAVVRRRPGPMAATWGGRSSTSSQSPRPRRATVAAGADNGGAGDWEELPESPTELAALVWQLRVENDELRRRQALGEEESAKAQAVHAAAQAELEQSRKQFKEEQARTASIEAENRNFFRENSQLLERIQALQEELAQELRAKARVEGALGTAEGHLEETLGELEALRSKRDKLTSRLTEAENSLRSEQHENEIMMRAIAEDAFRRKFQEAEDRKAKQIPRRRKRLARSCGR